MTDSGWKRPSLTVSQFPRASDNMRHQLRAELVTGNRIYEFMFDRYVEDGAAADVEWLRTVAKYCERMAKDLEATLSKELHG